MGHHEGFTNLRDPMKPPGEPNTAINLILLSGKAVRARQHRP
ncbi:hypothetical protein [Pantoea ananatis]|nr:hypothetical protein [Pantoea ananatis]